MRAAESGPFLSRSVGAVGGRVRKFGKAVSGLLSPVQTCQHRGLRYVCGCQPKVAPASIAGCVLACGMFPRSVSPHRESKCLKPKVRFAVHLVHKLAIKNRSVDRILASAKVAAKSNTITVTSLAYYLITGGRLCWCMTGPFRTLRWKSPAEWARTHNS